MVRVRAREFGACRTVWMLTFVSPDCIYLFMRSMTRDYVKQAG